MPKYPLRFRFLPSGVLAILLIAGLAVVYTLACLDGVSTGPSQLEGTLTIRSLYDQRTLGQVFYIDPARMVGVRVWFRFPQGRPDGMLSARLYSYDLQRNIGQASVPIRSLTENGPNDLRFDTIDSTGWNSNEPLTVELVMAVEGVSKDRPIIGVSGPNRYSNGPIVVNGRQRPSEDLVFAVLYRGTLFDSAIPITHIAEGRPGIFSWPPLYAMLCWLMLWAALVVLVNILASQPVANGKV